VAATNANVSNERLVAQGTGFITDDLVNVSAVDQQVVYTVTPTSAGGCVGDDFYITVTVRPQPVGVSQVVTTVCSDVVLGSGYQLSTTGTSVSAASYNIVSITNLGGLTPSAGLTLPGTGSGFAADVLTDDAWRNQTVGTEQIIYTLEAVSSAGCVSGTFTVTVDVDPEPATQAPVVTGAECSDVAVGYVLAVAGASSYSVSVNSNGLVQSAGSGTPNLISDDAWTNRTAGSVNVVYTVVPVSGVCNGDSFTVTIPISPEPFGSDDVASLCSDDGTLNYDLQDNIDSNNALVGTAFSWVAATNANVSNESLVA